MPEFIAVQCFKCNHYQVAQKRKDSKFLCKLCNAKQSVRKVVAHSDRAADVRKFVQQLNLTRGRAEEKFDEAKPHNPTGEESDESVPCITSAPAPDVRPQRVPSGQSRWEPYSNTMSKRNRIPDPHELDNSGNEDDILTALPDMEGKAHQRKRKRGSKQLNGAQAKIHQSLQIGAPLTRSTSPKNDESLPSKNQNRYQWGAAPWRGNRPAAKDSLCDVAVSSGRRSTYGWGRGVPPMKQSQGSANPQLRRGTQNRWAVLASQRPHNPQNNVVLSREVATAPESDGLLTTLGADEVVQEEVLY